MEFKQESESKTLKVFKVGVEPEYIQQKQSGVGVYSAEAEWSRSQKFQIPYTSANHITLAEPIAISFLKSKPLLCNMWRAPGICRWAFTISYIYY